MFGLNNASLHAESETANHVRIVGEVPLADLVEEWLAELRVLRRRPNTLASYRQTWRLFFRRTGLTRLEELTGPAIRSYLVSLERDHNSKPTTVHFHFRGLRAFARWAEMQEYPVAASLLRVKAPSLDEPVWEVYTPAQLKTLDRVMSKRYLLLIHFLLATGLRLSEALAWRWEDLIDDPGGYGDAGGYVRVLQSKNRQPRHVPISARLYRELLRRRNGSGGDPLVFGSVNRRALQSYCRLLSAKVGFRVHAHKFRHTFATRVMEERPDDIERLRNMLGHKSYAMVLRYAHMDRKSLGRGWEAVTPY